MNLIRYYKEGQKLSTFDNDLILKIGSLLGRIGSSKDDAPIVSQKLLTSTKSLIDRTIQAVQSHLVNKVVIEETTTDHFDSFGSNANTFKSWVSNRSTHIALLN